MGQGHLLPPGQRPGHARHPSAAHVCTHSSPLKARLRRILPSSVWRTQLPVFFWPEGSVSLYVLLDPEGHDLDSRLGCVLLMRTAWQP